MTTYNPTSALLWFFGIALFLFFFLRPSKGWLWLIVNNYKSNEKTIIEDILKLLYHKKTLSINDITTTLKFSDTHILYCIDKMTHSQLIYLKGDILALTQDGQDYAIRIVRVHRLWEHYLAEKTGFDKADWHEIAERKEHELELEEVNELAAHLGNPKYDPHGDPIPTQSGIMAPLEGLPLSNLTAGSIGEITHIEDEPEVIYKQILAANIHLGSQLKIIENTAKQLVFETEGETHRLAPTVAANLTVTEIKEFTTENIARLSSLQKGEKATIIALSKECRGGNRRRLLDLGFVRGAIVTIDLINTFADPTAYYIKGTSIALRNNQANKILIQKH